MYVPGTVRPCRRRCRPPFSLPSQSRRREHIPRIERDPVLDSTWGCSRWPLGPIPRVRAGPSQVLWARRLCAKLLQRLSRVRRQWRGRRARAPRRRRCRPAQPRVPCSLDIAAAAAADAAAAAAQPELRRPAAETPERVALRAEPTRLVSRPGRHRRRRQGPLVFDRHGSCCWWWRWWRSGRFQGPGRCVRLIVSDRRRVSGCATRVRRRVLISLAVVRSVLPEEAQDGHLSRPRVWPMIAWADVWCVPAPASMCMSVCGLFGSIYFAMRIIKFERVPRTKYGRTELRPEKLNEHGASSDDVMARLWCMEGQTSQIAANVERGNDSTRNNPHRTNQR